MSSSPLQDQGKVITDNPIRSRLDRRSYVLQELPNGLPVQWVQSPGAEESTVMLTVASGAFNDGGVPGIGHAAEHFILMGSEKYPRREELKQRVAKHGGFCNGWTGETTTLFWFEINTNAADQEADAKLEDVADVFFQQFIAPKFEPNTVGCEIKAIESEFQRQLRNDGRRLGQVLLSLSNPEHPSSGTFQCGNRKSLGDPMELLPKVIEHYKNHYCAGLMRCVIISPLPIKNLQERFLATLVKIPNRGLSRKAWDTTPLFLERDLGTETFVESVMDVDWLYIDFYFLGKEDDGYSARGEYAVDLFRQRAEGGLYDVLHRKQLVNYLEAVTTYEHAGNRKISIIADLTKTGVKNYQDVVQEVYYMIARMKAEGPQQERVKEQTRLQHIEFCTRQISDWRLARDMAINMLRPHLQPENLVYGSNEISIESGFNADEIVTNLDLMQPRNMKLVLVLADCKDLATKEEKWYGTKWGTRKISPDDMAKYTAAATLTRDQLPSEPKQPPPNRFIIKKDYESELLGPQRGWQDTTDEEEERRRPLPQALRTGENDIWFAPGEGQWAEPRIKIDMLIRSKNIFADAESSEKTCLFIESARRARATLFDQVGMAGMSCSASIFRDSLFFSITGFKNMLQSMLIEVLSAWRHHQPTEADVNTIKEDLLEGYQSAALSRPSELSTWYLYLLTSEHEFSLEQKEAALQAVTFDDLRDWGTNIFNTAQFQVLISGDVTEAEAVKLWPICQEELQLSWQPDEEPPRLRARLPPWGRISLFKRVMVDPMSENSHVNAVIFFAASRQAQYIAAPALLVQILKVKAFDKLRTEYGLGYDVGMGLEVGPQKSALKVWVECPKHSCLEAAQYMLEFLKQASSTVERLSTEELEKYREACIEGYDKKIRTLDEYHSWAGESIFEQTYAFHKSDRFSEELRKVKKDQLIDLAQQMDVSSPQGTQLWLFMEAKKRGTVEKNPAYIDLFPKSREVAFVTDVFELPVLSTPEEAEENPEDFLVKPEECVDAST